MRFTFLLTCIVNIDQISEILLKDTRIGLHFHPLQMSDRLGVWLVWLLFPFDMAYLFGELILGTLSSPHLTTYTPCVVVVWFQLKEEVVVIFQSCGSQTSSLFMSSVFVTLFQIYLLLILQLVTVSWMWKHLFFGIFFQILKSPIHLSLYANSKWALKQYRLAIAIDDHFLCMKQEKNVYIKLT